MPSCTRSARGRFVPARRPPTSPTSISRSRPTSSRCSRSIACGDHDVSYFSAAAGGTLCSSCAKDVPGAQQLSASEIGWVASLLHLTFDDLLASQIDVTTSTTLVSLAHTWAATHLDARLRAMEFMLSL